MIGAEMRAVGSMGEMKRSVWSEGSVAGSGGVAQSIMARALREGQGSDFPMNLTVDGKAYSLQVNANTTPEQMANVFKQAGIGQNVAGLIGNAMRSHILSDGGETRQPLNITITT